MDNSHSTINLTPAAAAGLAAAIMEGRWHVLTTTGDDTNRRVVQMNHALAMMAAAAGLAPGVMQTISKLVGAGRRGDILLRVFTEPKRYAFAHSTVVEWNEGVMFCALSGATLEW